MTTFLNRLPKMILTISALTFGAAGVAVAAPGHNQAPGQFAPAQHARANGPAKRVAKHAKMTKMQRKQAKLQRKQANRSKKHAKRLATFDSNGNGKIEKAERVAVRQQRFVAIDSNRDGALTLGEMQVAKAARNAAKRAERAQRVATLSPEKQAKRAKKMAKRNARRAQANKPGLAKRFAKLDANKNGTVSRSEFVKRPGKRKGKGHKRGKGKSKRS